MNVSQSVFSAANPPGFAKSSKRHANQLILIFGSVSLLNDNHNFLAVRAAYPDAVIVGCSTAGEIHDTTVTDDTLVVTVVSFAHTSVQLSRVDIEDVSQSYAAGQSLAESLPQDELKHVLIFSDSLTVDGTQLVRGLKSRLADSVEITGGMSANGTSFQQALVCANDIPKAGQIAAVGLYGQRIRIGYASLGGWHAFGPEREVTKAEGNVLFDLDHKPALSLYKNYLGVEANGLPATGLRYPLLVSHTRDDGDTLVTTSGVVRTILATNEENQSITFADDIPQGGYVRLMKSNYDQLVDGAATAAALSISEHPADSSKLALLISGVGRKIILRERVEEEIESVRGVLGDKVTLSGFYSYGEIAPARQGAECVLQNQTMTITTFFEA